MGWRLSAHVGSEGGWLGYRAVFSIPLHLMSWASFQWFQTQISQ